MANQEGTWRISIEVLGLSWIFYGTEQEADRERKRRQYLYEQEATKERVHDDK